MTFKTRFIPPDMFASFHPDDRTLHCMDCKQPVTGDTSFVDTQEIRNGWPWAYDLVCVHCRLVRELTGPCVTPLERSIASIQLANHTVTKVLK